MAALKILEDKETKYFLLFPTLQDAQIARDLIQNIPYIDYENKLECFNNYILEFRQYITEFKQYTSNIFDGTIKLVKKIMIHNKFYKLRMININGKLLKI